MSWNLNRWNTVCSHIRQYKAQLEGVRESLLQAPCTSEEGRITLCGISLIVEMKPYLFEIHNLFTIRQGELETTKTSAPAESKVLWQQELDDLIEEYQDVIKGLI